jgi:hypothetical protein
MTQAAALELAQYNINVRLLSGGLASCADVGFPGQRQGSQESFASQDTDRDAAYCPGITRTPVRFLKPQI